MVLVAVLIRLEFNFFNPRFYGALLSYIGTMCFLVVIPAAIFLSLSFAIYMHCSYTAYNDLYRQYGQQTVRDMHTERKIWGFYDLCIFMTIFAAVYYVMAVIDKGETVLYVVPVLLGLPALVSIIWLWKRYGHDFRVQKAVRCCGAAFVVTAVFCGLWSTRQSEGCVDDSPDYGSYPVVSLEDFYADADKADGRLTDLSDNENGSLLVDTVVFYDHAEELGTVSTEYYEVSDPFVAGIIFSGMAENELVFEQKRRLPIEDGIYGDVKAKYYTKDDENFLLINKDEKIFYFKGDVDFTSDEGVKAVRRVLDRF